MSALVLVAPALTLDSGGFFRQLDVGQLLRFAWTRVLLGTDGATGGWGAGRGPRQRALAASMGADDGGKGGPVRASGSAA